MVRLALLVFMALIVGGVATWPPSAVHGHALLVSSDPPVNARLLDLPLQVTASFSEALDDHLSSLQVLDGRGNRVDVGPTSFSDTDPRRMSVGLRSDLSPGYYIVVWETLSTIDGHLLKGSFPFTLLNANGSEPVGPKLVGFDAGTVTGGEPTAGTVITKWLILAGSAILVGSLVFGVAVVRCSKRHLQGDWEDRTCEASHRRVFRMAGATIIFLAAIGVVELIVQSLQLGGLDRIGSALDLFWGERWIQRQAVLGTVAISLVLAWLLWRRLSPALAKAALWAALVGGLGYLILLSMISHAGSVQGSFWAVASDFVHLLAAVVWVGMLLQLAMLFVWSRRGLAGDVRARALSTYLERFSAIAAASLILLLATGVANAAVELSRPEDLVKTSYGWVLAAKLAAIVPLLLVTSLNALVLRPALLARVAEEGGGERIRRLFTRLIALEVCIAVGVLLITAVLIQFPTARQEAAAAEFERVSTETVLGFEETRPAGELSVSMSISPNAVGTNSFQVFIFPPPGQDLAEVLRVRLRFKPPDPTLGPSEVIAEQEAPNFFRAVGSFFARPGDWEVEVDLRRREVDDVSAYFSVPVVGAGAVDRDGRFDLPLVAGSWATVGVVGSLVGGLLLWVGVSRWPGLPRSVLRSLRVGRVASTMVGITLTVVVITGLIEFVDDASSSGNPVKPTSESIAVGRSLFLRNCSVCHGDTGRGDGPLAATLDVPPTDFRVHIPFHSDEFFFLVMTNGFGNVMPSFGEQLSEEERWHILNFLQSEFGIDAQTSEEAE